KGRALRYPREALSLPIRGSDKCGTALDKNGTVQHGTAFEAACIPWDSYLDIIDAMRRYDPGLKNVLITTEDMRYLRKAKDHQETLASSKADLQFVFNDEDTPLGSSKVGEIMRNNAVAHAEEEKVHLNFFTSMMTTLEMHTRSKYLVLNCRYRSPGPADRRHPGGTGRTYAEAVTPIVATEIAGAEDPGRPPPPLFKGAPSGPIPGARLLSSAAVTPRPDFMSMTPARHFMVATPAEFVVAGKSGPATPSLSPTTTPQTWSGGMVQTRHRAALPTPFREAGATAYAGGQPASALRTSSSIFRVTPRATGHIASGECLIIPLVITRNLASMNGRRAPMWTSTGGCARKTEVSVNRTPGPVPGRSGWKSHYPPLHHR
ncbi:hypothetical protein CYMTET_17345, partial [Cymbomonas tetramitiformis]